VGRKSIYIPSLKTHIIPLSPKFSTNFKKTVSAATSRHLPGVGSGNSVWIETEYLSLAVLQQNTWMGNVKGREHLENLKTRAEMDLEG
jgi:hypothetical protein